jgi:serine/threonine protein phosphatase PrpC
MNRLVIDVGMSVRPGSRNTGGSATLMERLAPEDTPLYGALLGVAELAGNAEDEPEKAVLASFKQEFLQVPEYWSVEEVLRASFSKANKSVRTDVYNRHVVTLSSAVIQGRHLFIGHIGNNRIWLFRDGRLQQLTSDHTQPRVNQDPLLTRACGIENEVEIDFRVIDLHKGDAIILANHNTHKLLDGSAIISGLVEQHSAERMAEAVANLAVGKNAESRVSVAVARIDQLPDENADIGMMRHYPAAGKLPADGQTVDGFRIRKRRRKGRLAHYYSAEDLLDDSNVLLKFADPTYIHGSELVDCFIRDEWLSRQIDHPVIARPAEVSRGRRSVLYSVLQPVEGENLLARVGRKGRLTVGEVRLVARQLLDFLEHIHQQHIVHRDIRPENILLNKADKTIHLLSFDSHRIRYWVQQGPEKAFSVLSLRYLAPESFGNSGSDARADIYATGVTLYYLLTGKLPYGNARSLDDLSTRPYRPIAAYNESVPESMADAITRACSKIPDHRFAGAVEFLDALLTD